MSFANLAKPGRKLVIRDRLSLLGGARRDRTDDLMLAKHALYQLSYGPQSLEAAAVGSPGIPGVVDLPSRPPEGHTMDKVWWAQADSNCRPHAYQACALTT